MKIRNLMVVGTTLLMVGVVLITTMGIILIQGNMNDVNDENTTSAKSSLEEEIGTGAENTAVEILNTLDRIMENQVMMVKSWTRSPVVVEAAKDATGYTMEELYDCWSDPATRQYDDGEAMGDGKPQNDISFDASNFLITLSQDAQGAYPEIFFTDARGYAIAASGATGDFDQGPDDWRAFDNTSGGPDIYLRHGPSLYGEEWWAAANAAPDGVYVSPIEYDDSAYVWATAICVVIWDGSTNVGVVKAIYNFAFALSSVMDTTGLEADEIKIINQEGLIVASSEEDQTKLMNPDITVTDMESFQNAKTGNNGYSVEVDEDNDEMVIGYASCEGDDLICLVSHKTSTSMVPIRDIESKNTQLISDVNAQVMIIIVTEVAVAVVILVAVATLLNRKLTKPLVDIADSAKEIKDGNLNVKVDESGNNEITELARAFNQMVLSVRLISGETEMEGPGMGDFGPQNNLMK